MVTLTYHRVFLIYWLHELKPVSSWPANLLLLLAFSSSSEVIPLIVVSKSILQSILEVNGVLSDLRLL